MNISQMTNEQLNEALAIEVMGWVRDGDKYWSEMADGKAPRLWSFVGLCGEWNPAEDLNQAVECAGELYKMNDRNILLPAYEFILEQQSREYYRAHMKWFAGRVQEGFYVVGNSPARALSEAVLMAKRGEK